MVRRKVLITTILASSVATYSLAGLAQGDVANSCGPAPTEPTIVDGAEVAMAELVENSKAVNAFIESADDYLDCQEALVKSTTNGLSRAVKNEISEGVKSLTERRNSIGDEFNAQVEAFKAAN